MAADNALNGRQADPVPATSQLLERLVQQGLVVRSEDPNHRRLRQITLSKQGDVVLQEGLQARQKWLEDLVKLMSPDEQEQVNAVLNIMLEKALNWNTSLPQNPSRLTFTRKKAGCLCRRLASFSRCFIKATAKGRQVVQESTVARQSWFGNLASALSESEKGQVITALNILIDKTNRLDINKDKTAIKIS